MPGILLVFRISVLGLACLGSAILALAEGSPLPGLLTLPVAVLAFFLTEQTRKVELSPIWANLFGLAAFAAAGLEFSRDSLESRFLALAHLLVYLSWVLFFQPKKVPQYWWLCALALLQVAVGSVLTRAGAYGLVLTLFLFAAVWTLAVFSLCQAHVRIGHLPEFAALAANARPAPADFFGASSSVLGGGAAWPSALRGPAVAHGAVHSGPGERWLGLRFFSGAVATTCLSLVLSAAFFLLTPRLWTGQRSWLDAGTEFGGPMTGFTDEVSLGDIGQILESTERVFDVRIVRIDGDFGTQPLDVLDYARDMGRGDDGEPLFRGAVLGKYDRGRWTAPQTYEGLFYLPRIGNYPVVRQDYRLRRARGGFLFTIPPIAGCVLGEPPEGDVNQLRRLRRDGLKATRYQPETGTILGPKSGAEVRYSAYSPADSRDELAARLLSDPDRGLSAEAREYYLALPRAGLERLVRLAQDVTSGGGGPPPRTGDRAVAEKLVRHLRDEGGFTYSLNLSIEDSRLDPVEDFLFNRKSGHCEYYASALALMLRAVGIPARLVSGFKGGARNRFTGYFEVEERHAHAWVEAYCDGRWIELDATPAAARNESVDSLASGMQSWRDFVGLVSELWDRYVLRMNYERQQTEFFDPVRESLSGWWDALRDRKVTAGSLWAWLRNTFSSPEKWLSWQAWVVTFILLFVLVGLTKLTRRAWSMWPGRHGLIGRKARGHASSVAFYERFRALCRAHGLERHAAQTHREFAGTVAGALGEPLSEAELLQLPAEVVDWFYRVRFGNRPLDAATAESLDRRLAGLEAALAAGNGKRPSVHGRATKAK
ncbi:MAG: transglutaminaseTgpA domain-containing protein [Planctomycetales bacterium]